ncbi:hypothetical protein HY995_01335 [Candidatus Micrarchaeota archaeon]|nr:hypothetical protein [Candidatus Micrarchaeota archaeon]MBI5176710.1 hypothetical protein [Candidatus Micrarchaeota archaeon]
MARGKGSNAFRQFVALALILAAVVAVVVVYNSIFPGPPSVGNYAERGLGPLAKSTPVPTIPGQHTACRDGKCSIVPGGGGVFCIDDLPCKEPAQHSTCVEGECRWYDGPGPVGCTTSPCSTATPKPGGTPTPTPEQHTECIAHKGKDGTVYQSCDALPGAGPPGCKSSDECFQPIQHSKCDLQSLNPCQFADGPGSMECKNDAGCTAPAITITPVP